MALLSRKVRTQKLLKKRAEVRSGKREKTNTKEEKRNRVEGIQNGPKKRTSTNPISQLKKYALQLHDPDKRGPR